MAKTLEIIVNIKDEDGETIVTKTSERNIPYIQEIEEQGFRAAFHDLETAVLESRKEAGNNAIAEYLAEMSKKNRQ